MSLEREFSSTEYFDWLWIYKGPRLILELGAEERQSTLPKIFESVCDGKRREGGRCRQDCQCPYCFVGQLDHCSISGVGRTIKNKNIQMEVLVVSL